MRAIACCLLLLLSAPRRGGRKRLEQGQLCRAAIGQAERERGIPPRLLAAIGRVESGRRDPATGATHPWPWAINAEGRGSFYPDKAAAIAAVRALQAQGVRSIDVGCLQINLRHHPEAFASLEEAFDPLANARYGARFLASCRPAAPTGCRPRPATIRRPRASPSPTAPESPPPGWPSRGCRRRRPPPWLPSRNQPAAAGRC